MLEVFTTGGGEFVVNTFNAVAAWSGGGGYRSLLRVVMVIGFAYALLAMAWNMDPKVLFRWFMQSTLMYLVMMVPTVSVKVTDRANPGLAPATVANVPMGLGLMASFTSQVGDYLTRSAETVFVMPNALGYSTNGIIYGAKLMEATQGLRISDPRLATNLNEHFKQCVFYDVLLGRKTFDDIARASDIMASIGPGSVSLSQTWIAADGSSSIVTCREAYTNLQNEWQTYYNADAVRIAQQFFPGLDSGAAQAKFNTDVAGVGSAGLGGGGTGSAQLVRQAMFINALMQARDSFGSSSAQTSIDAFATTRADIQTRNTYSTIAAGAMKWVPLLNIVLTVVFYAMFPVLFLLMLMPNTGPGIAKGYLTGFFYLASWGPLFVVLNMIFMSRWQAALVPWQSGGLTAWNFSGVSAINQDAGALAGYMIMSVPFIAAGMARGAMSIASHSASFLAPSQNAAEQAAAEITTGNYSYGNVSLANRTINTASSDQFNTAANYNTGSGLVSVRNPDGGLSQHAANGSTIYKSPPGMSELPFGLTHSEGYQSEVRKALSEGFGHVEQTREAASQSWTAARSNATQLFETAQRSASSGTEEGRALTSSISRMQDLSLSMSENLQNRFGLDKQTSDSLARTAIMSGDISGSAGANLVVAALNGSTRLGSSAERRTGGDIRASDGFSEVFDYVRREASSDAARSARESFTRATTSSSNSDLRGMSERFDASLSEARGRSVEASNAEETFNRYSRDFAQAESHGFQFSQNETQALADFMRHELDRPENWPLQATGYYPGLVSPNAQQSAVRDTLIRKFVDEKVGAMREELGVVPDAPGRSIAGPASRSVGDIQAWGHSNQANLQSRAPAVHVAGAARDREVEGLVSARVDDSRGRLDQEGREMHNTGVMAHDEADRVRGDVDRRQHSSLGGTLPIVGNIIDKVGVRGTPGNPFEGGFNARVVAREAGAEIKQGVNLSGTDRSMSSVFGAVTLSGRELGLPGAVVTSGQDGRHKHDSLHPEGKALDFRGNNISVAQGRAWAGGVKSRLGADYDVIFETFPRDPERNHLHVEHDPKSPRGR
ncbi:conjugal transfer protein TraG N-terminal domain-containing protein [Novosphingobium sp. G106]|uniref:conjugal transfer protein TraG N-terminal domain-containing protein n=1 Tax=Novosphingobium sp. G106 TaxID=2849500 RepID=UPI001C2D97D8|nr:conjugal transfer protein TraG N-terminal domain-containing protein [Novosphingobium sp. G106]MBV1692237.1 conjugal transfer protein TraG N-terminal domain-containing protein [Novosphingobium sp. G106]